ncbi:hypothetical protein BKA82DRAFT_4215800 [Pisolithus tinctorius]|nr:hypothetical protein BKA82DRAFT_4215800 [Pisolithus tinctorius]
MNRPSNRQLGRHHVTFTMANNNQLCIDDHGSWHARLFVPGTNQNVNLSDHGNATPGTPVTLWGKWNGNNQLWHIESIGGVH